MKTARSFFVCACIATMAMPVYAENIAGNPGFEMAGVGGPTDSDLWTEFAGGAAGTLSERDGTMPASGSWAHHLLAIGDDTAGASAGINQNSIADVGLPSLLPGTTLDASFDWKASYGPGGVGFGVLRILNGDGAIVADTGLLALPASDSYSSFTVPGLTVPDFGPAPNDVYAAFLEISVSSGAFEGSVADAFVDNVVINGTVVPEPSSLCLILAGTLLWARRR
jgi:hypothetical protein